MHKNDNSDFLRRVMLESENFEFQVIFFCHIPKNDNSEFYFYIWDRLMLGSENFEFRVIVFCLILKNGNSEVF